MINKTMDIDDLKTDEAKQIIYELNSLIRDLKSKKQKISSWYGIMDLDKNIDYFEKANRGYDYTPIESSADDANFPWYLYWEIVWVVKNNNFNFNQKILDLGGSSSLFSYYLASKGYDVTTIDIQKELVDNANKVSEEMKWNLKNYIMNMRDIKLDHLYDHITSICVFEHIPRYERIKINERIKEMLASKGKFSITFDYRNPDMHAQIKTTDDVYKQFIKPSGLKIRDNDMFMDNNKNYLICPFYNNKICKKDLMKIKIKLILSKHFKVWEVFKTKNYNDYTFGALFLEKD